MDGEQSLQQDQRFFIDEICRIIQEENIDAVILAGDVYDRSVASAEAIQLYDYAMTKICGELQCQAFVIAGNHDSAERLASCSGLLSAAGLHIAGALKREINKVSFEDANVYLLPWFTEEKAKSLFPEKKEEITSLSEAYRVVLEQIKADFQPGKKNIVAAHAFIGNAEVSDSDRAAVIGNAAQVESRVFEGVDYVALGHIHKPQNITETIRYSGTPMPYSFGKEEKQEKSVTILDTADMKPYERKLPLLHRRTTLTGTLEEILAPTCGDDVKNGYVRLQITDSYVGLETMTRLKTIYQHPLIVSGKTYEGEESSITMTLEEFEKLETDPVEIFRHFCREETGSEAEEHQIALFQAAVNKYMEENNE